MKIETQSRDDHQVKIIVEVDAEPFESAKHKAARHLAQHTKIPGFRPGKAPYNIILRQLGETAIIEEATEILVNDIYPKALDEAGVEPYGPGSLENIPSLDPPTFEFIVPLKAVVELGDYRSIRIPYELKEVTDNDVEDVVLELRERQAVLEPAERAAQESDMVYLRLSGKRLNANEDQDPTLIRERVTPVVIEREDADTTNEWPLPGFSRQLIGLSTNDEKTITYTYPDDSPYETLRGTEAEFQLVVQEIKSRTLPELNDEFAQSLGEFTDLTDLRAKIREDLEARSRESYHSDYDNHVLEDVVNLSVVKYPPQMVEREIDNVIENLKQRLAQQNLDFDLYLKSRDMDLNALREESRPVAETRLKKSLVLLELSEAEKIKVEPDALQAETTRTLDEMSRMLPKEEARKLGDKEVVSNLIGNILMDMMTRQTTERMRAIAGGEAAIIPDSTAGEELPEAVEDASSESESGEAESDRSESEEA